MDSPVTRAAFEARLAPLADADPIAGVFGPQSVLWTVGRESLVLLAGGRAALLQIAHPFVADAVVQHSTAFDDLAARFRRTLHGMYAMTFGGRDDALRLARRLHGVHARIGGTLDADVGRFRRGDPYRANDPAALLWVAATLWDGSTDIFQRVVRPLTEDERTRYLVEARRFARLFGVPPSMVPRDWASFRAYVDEMTTRTLAVGDAARRIADHILSPPRPAAAPVFRWMRILTAGLLPPHLRDAFGLPFGVAERAVFRASMTALRHGTRRLPAGLRYTPAYLRAMRRLDGRDGDDPVAATMRRVGLKLMQRPQAA
ncbi:MAG: DUF2236 domain-containing protein [Myxococcales bacterium]|nr:DUF2236 domain-containing protein [Myxococcales bacterium]